MTDNARAFANRRRAIVWIAAPVLAVLALTAWALSSPVGSSPDDDFHLASIWCGVGDRDGLCEPGDAEDERAVPDDLLASPCYAYDPDTSAECQATVFDGVPLDLDSSDRGNFAGQYPPLFYFIAGLAASDQLETSVVAIRIANSVLFVGGVTALAALLPPLRRRAAVLAVVVTSTPLGVFLIASTNPSSWALLSAALVLPALVGYFETTGARRIGLAVVATLGAVVGAGARADSAVFVGLACIASIVLCARRSRAFLLSVVLPVALLAVAFVSYRSAGQSGLASTGLGESPSAVSSARALELFLLTVLDVPSLWVGAVGGWGLGWLDTPLPDVVWVAGSVVLAGAVLWGATRLDRRGAIVTLGLLTVAWAFPTYLQVQTQALVGAYVQPRYVLPLLVLLVFAALSARTDALPRPLLVIGIGALAASFSISLHTNLRRYTHGLDVLKINLGSDPEWWWTVAPSPTIIWIAGTVAFTALLVLLAAAQWRAVAALPPAKETQA